MCVIFHCVADIALLLLLNVSCCNNLSCAHVLHVTPLLAAEIHSQLRFVVYAVNVAFYSSSCLLVENCIIWSSHCT